MDPKPSDQPAPELEAEPAPPVQSSTPLRPSTRRPVFTRERFAVVISLIALVLSFVAFMTPIVERVGAQHRAAEDYLVHLASRGSTSAQYFAEEGSPAADLAIRIRSMWVIHYDEDAALGKVLTGGWLFPDGTFDVCFTDHAAIPLNCAEVADIEYSERGEVSDFTWDGVPIAAMMDYNERPLEALAIGTDAIPVTVEPIGGLIDLGKPLRFGEEVSPRHGLQDGTITLQFEVDASVNQLVRVESLGLRDSAGNEVSSRYVSQEVTDGMKLWKSAVTGKVEGVDEVEVCLVAGADGSQLTRWCNTIPAYW